MHRGILQNIDPYIAGQPGTQRGISFHLVDVTSDPEALTAKRPCVEPAIALTDLGF